MPAVIAILAMLLLFIAPEVSKTLAHQRMENREEQAHSSTLDNQHEMVMMMSASGGGDATDTMPGMDMSDMQMPSHSGADSSHTMPDMMMHHAGMGEMMDDAACGYCVMLMHMPVLLLIFAAIIWLAFNLSVAPPPRLITRRFSLYFPGVSQPRAPPHSFIAVFQIVH